VSFSPLGFLSRVCIPLQFRFTHTSRNKRHRHYVEARQHPIPLLCDVQVGSYKQARNEGIERRGVLADAPRDPLVAASRGAGDDDSWSERDSQAEGMDADEVSAPGGTASALSTLSTLR
jgi:hypothetical protein